MSKMRFNLFVAFLSILTAGSTPVFAKTHVNSPLTIDYYNISRYYSLFYKALGSDAPKPGYDVFVKALTGFFNLKAEKEIRNNLLTIIDFSISSSEERMWIVDMDRMRVVHSSLVAHGRNSGGEFAKYFSNKPSSNQSSLGFYITDGTYYGKHGLSLYLDGVEPGVNDKIRGRTIVMHSAGYVSHNFIRKYGQLGRSFGCPSIPEENHEVIINMLRGRSCIYVHYPDTDYLSTSPMLSLERVAAGMNIMLSKFSEIVDFYPEP